MGSYFLLSMKLEHFCVCSCWVEIGSKNLRIIHPNYSYLESTYEMYVILCISDKIDSSSGAYFSTYSVFNFKVLKL